ncbi:hypothetical protein B0H14DRAFT_2684074 [Mycena olivaceomarginata]|nr:hypothetical protein B0H14DRAFT_2684074 [Mycena olivaceomarginata]
MSSLEAYRARVADIEATILDLHISISKLRAEQEIAQEWLDSYTYPVLTLPNEIVSEIFIHSLPQYPRICRKWRAVALTTPMLWRAIKLSCAYTPWIEYGYIVDNWLSWSGCRPLSICVDDYATRPVDMSGVFSAIASHRARWQYLRLHLGNSQLSADPFAAIEGPMPLVRYLDLELSAPIAFAVRDAPRLRTVVLDGVAASNVTLPWVQLTSLTLRMAKPSLCFPILQKTAKLVNCILHLWLQDEVVDHLPAHNIALPCLESLILSNRYDDGAIAGPNLLAPLILPSLLRLTIPELFLGPDPIDSLMSFTLKSGCNLQEMATTGRRHCSLVSDNDYRAALPAIPSVTLDYDSSDGESSSE